MHQVVAWKCQHCGRLYEEIDQAESCEGSCMAQAEQAERRADEQQRLEAELKARGEDVWYEDGMKHAPRVNPALFGGHSYTYEGTSDCAHGCGCWMGPTRSGGL